MPHDRPRYAASSLPGDRRGGVIVTFALALPVVLLLVGNLIDFVLVRNQRATLQAALDSATLAAARELGLADARREQVAAVVQARVLAATRANLPGQRMPLLQTKVRSDPLEVEVTASQPTSLFFKGVIGHMPLSITVRSVARIVGQPNICVLALDPSLPGTISLEKEARVTANNCAVFSNSTNVNGIMSKSSAVLTASLICTAGGKDGGPANFSPPPLTDCPTFDDPLAGRPEPSIGPCMSLTRLLVTSSRTLSPGTYCGGIDIGGGAVVVLDPGVYIIRDGSLRVGDGATLRGQGVGLYMTGTGAELRLEAASTIELAAPTGGPMAGLLVFEGRNQSTRAIHRILSDDARMLIGTLYLPRGTLQVDAGKPVADQSAYTAIVARQLTLFGGPHLVLNTNYDATDVPVPQGIRGASQPVALAQ
jgi:hypothetical protein